MELKCKCGHGWNYKGKSEHYATCPRCHNLVNVKKAIKQVTELPPLTPEEIAVLDRCDNEPEYGASACDPWAGCFVCKECYGGIFETISFVSRPRFCPICGAEAVVRWDMVPDFDEKHKEARDRKDSTPR